jgi:hypothetical protein
MWRRVSTFGCRCHQVDSKAHSCTRAGWNYGSTLVVAVISGKEDYLEHIFCGVLRMLVILRSSKRIICMVRLCGIALIGTDSSRTLGRTQARAIHQEVGQCVQ